MIISAQFGMQVAVFRIPWLMHMALIMGIPLPLPFARSLRLHTVMLPTCQLALINPSAASM